MPRLFGRNKSKQDQSHVLFIVILSMLSIIMLSIIMLSIIMQSIIIIVTMENYVLLSDVRAKAVVCYRSCTCLEQTA